MYKQSLVEFQFNAIRLIACTAIKELPIGPIMICVSIKRNATRSNRTLIYIFSGCRDRARERETGGTDDDERRGRGGRPASGDPR